MSITLPTTEPADAAELPDSGPGFLRLIAETRSFALGRPANATPTPDGKHVLFLRAEPRSPVLSLYEFEVATGKTRALLTPAELLRGAEEKLSAPERARRERMRITTRGFTGYELSQDGALLLVQLSGKLYTVRRADGKASELPVAPPILDPRLSPDGTRVAYVRERDLYVLDLASGKELRLTNSKDPAITNGLAEFVAQEEMDRFRGYWWSPDGAQLAFEEADNHGVEELTIADPVRPESEAERFRYPRPGKPNATVRLGVIPSTGGAPTWIGWDGKRFEYLASVSWRKNAPLTLVVMTRAQKDVAVLAADEKTGTTRLLHAEHDDVWLNLDQSTPRWLPDGSGFLWSSDRDGLRRLELRDRAGKLVRPISPADVALIKLVHIDGARRQAYFLGAADPTEQHLYSASLDGGAAERLTKDAGVHTASFGDGDAPLWVEVSMTPSILQRTTVIAGGREAGQLPSVAIEPPLQPRVEFAEVRAGDETFHALLVRPRNFDPAKRYPVWLDVYGGPHHLTVVRAMHPSIMRQWIADHGYIVVGIDNRGTPHRGRKFERAIHGDFSALLLDDQVAALQALGAKYKELDLARVGVVGWSFGGYMAALAAMRRPDVFRVAVAGAPVVDWRDYDTCYTERYLGLLPESAKNYEASSLLTHAPKLQRPLLLIHGTADDNVYFFHSLKLADALLRAGRPVDLLPLAGFTHLVPDPVVRERMWERILDLMGTHLHP